MNIKLDNILCPVDFSETANLAAQYAVAFARMNKARLTLLHVVAPPVTALPSEAGMLAMPQADIREITTACMERLDALITELKATDMEIDCQVLSGIPYNEIVQYAETSGSDMIVMGSRGRTGLSHLLLGSVAEHVVRKATCPVLTVKGYKRAQSDAG